MNDQDLRQAVIRFIEDYCRKHKKSPSLRKILDHFKQDRLNFARFYKVFPGRLAEACSLAGVPIPEDRIKRMKKVIKASKDANKDTIKAFPLD